MPLADVTLTVSAGPLYRTVLQQVRGELARAVQDVSATETDARVVARLQEVAALLVGTMAAAEATSAAQTAPVTFRRYGGDKPGTAPAEKQV